MIETSTPELRIYLDERDIDPISGYPWAWDGVQTAHQKIAPIKDYVRARDGHRCLRCGHPYPPGVAKDHPRGEWTPCDDRCTHGGPVRVWAGESEDEHVTWEEVLDLDPRAWMGYEGRSTFKMQAQWRILTVHHLNGVKADCRWFNLVSLCQRCHLTIQGRVVMERSYHRPHSPWFRPFAAAYYADRFLGIEIPEPFEPDDPRIDEYLALELREEPLF